MIDEDLSARIAPETMQKNGKEINVKVVDMLSFAVPLWDLATRLVPFAELSSMEAGLKIALEGLRVSIPPGSSSHMAKLIRICMNEDPGKRPTFDMITPIFSKR